MIEDRFRTMGAGEIADLLDKNELEGRDYFNCVYRAMVLLREQAQTEAAKPAVPEVLFDGYAVLQAMSEKAKARTSPENVSDVLDAAVKLIRAAPPLPVAQGVPEAFQKWYDAAPTPPAAPKEPTCK